jgi:hypothetical protein
VSVELRLFRALAAAEAAAVDAALRRYGAFLGLPASATEPGR